MIHGELKDQNIHIPYSFDYLTQIDREQATGFNVSDLGKLSRQLDDNTLWMLVSITPTVVWSGIASGTNNGISSVSNNGIAFPGTPVNYELFYRTDISKLYFWDGVAWVDLALGINTAYMSVFLNDKRPSGSHHSSINKDEWNVRAVLETIDPHSLLTQTSDDFHLKVGVYRISGYASGSGILRLYNEATGLDLVIGTPSETTMDLLGTFKITDASYPLEIQHWATSDDDINPIDNGSDELYMTMEIQKIGDI